MKYIGTMLVIAALLAVSGCSTLNGSGYKKRADIFNYAGLPEKEYLVGGGYFISYRATVAGDLFLADEPSGRLIATVSLQPGEEHEMIYDITDEKLSKNLDALGIDPQKAKFKLFFVPR